VPSNFLQLAVVFRCALWEASPELLAKYEDRRNDKQEREWGKHGWSNNERRGRERGEKKEDRHPPHVTSLQLVGGGCAYADWLVGAEFNAPLDTV